MGPFVPGDFQWEDATEAAPGSTVQSDTIQLVGFGGEATVVLDGPGSPEFSVNGGDWQGEPGSISSGDSIQIQATTEPESGYFHQIVVEVDGEYIGTWLIENTE